MVDGRVMEPDDPSMVGGGDKDPNVSPARGGNQSRPRTHCQPGVLKVLSSGSIPDAFPLCAFESACDSLRAEGDNIAAPNVTFGVWPPWSPSTRRSEEWSARGGDPLLLYI